jgi:hypothetical protein
MDLERAKSDLVSALGAEFLDERPNDAVLVESLRAALAEVCAFAPFEERSVVLEEDGREVDLSSLLVDLVEIGAIMREVDAEDAEGEWVGAKWRDMGSGRIQVLGGDEPLADEELFVRYRRAYAVAGLDGEATTTLPYLLQRSWVMRACAEVVDLTLRRKVQTGGRLDDDEGRRFQAVARDYRARASRLMNVQVTATMVTWADLGE